MRMMYVSAQHGRMRPDPNRTVERRGMARMSLTLVGALLLALLSVGTAGAATLRGGGAPDNLGGSGGGDVLIGRGGDDVVFGRGGGDVVHGGTGADAVYGDAGRDMLLGGPGDDHLYADDGRRDSVSCGGGRDTVFADSFDRVSGCEIDGKKALKGGVLATFEASDERFQAWVTDPRAMWDLRQLQRGESTANIPNGRVLRGPGLAGHNAPYSWHFDPEDVEMADMTIEVCDAEPSYVEENVGEFVDNVGRYCAWDARLVDLKNYTGGEIEPPAPIEQPPLVTFPDEG